MDVKENSFGVGLSKLVIMAIYNLGEKLGSTENEIVRFVSEKYGLEERSIEAIVRSTLKRGLEFGVLSLKNGRFVLEEDPDRPPPVESDGISENRTSASVGVKRGRLEVLSEEIEKGILEWKTQQDRMKRGNAKRLKRSVRAGRSRRVAAAGKGKRQPKNAFVRSLTTFGAKSGSKKPSGKNKSKTKSEKRPAGISGRTGKQCPVICPRACPKSIERIKQKHSRETEKGKMGGFGKTRTMSRSLFLDVLLK